MHCHCLGSRCVDVGDWPPPRMVPGLRPPRAATGAEAVTPPQARFAAQCARANEHTPPPPPFRRGEGSQDNPCGTPPLGEDAAAGLSGVTPGEPVSFRDLVCRCGGAIAGGSGRKPPPLHPSGVRDAHGCAPAQGAPPARQVCSDTGPPRNRRQELYCSRLHASGGGRSARRERQSRRPL